MDVKQAVREFLLSNFYVADPDTLVDDASLLDQGVIDSTGMLELIFFIEQKFGIKVENAEMVPENLDTVEAVAAFVDRKKS